MQTLIKLIYRYRARSISELYDKCSASEFASIVYHGKYSECATLALELFVKDNLEIQRKNRWEYFLSFQKYDEVQENELIRLFETQRIDIVLFAECLRDVLNCVYPKINAMKFVGRPNSGKSLLAQLICKMFICCYANNHGSENEFFLSNFLNKSIILCEELYVTQATAEDFKQILGGAPIDIDKKFYNKQILMRTPMIITSNYNEFGRGHLPHVDEQALKLRCITFDFISDFKPKCMIEMTSLAHLMWCAVNQDML